MESVNVTAAVQHRQAVEDMSLRGHSLHYLLWRTYIKVVEAGCGPHMILYPYSLSCTAKYTSMNVIFSFYMNEHREASGPSLATTCAWSCRIGFHFKNSIRTPQKTSNRVTCPGLRVLRVKGTSVFD